jgi:hypothetical protein
MSALAPVMEGFFTERLLSQRRASPHTVASYRDTFRLLLSFAQRRTGKAPSKLDIQDLDAVIVGAFLDHLERERHNSVRTRNNRLVSRVTDSLHVPGGEPPGQGTKSRPRTSTNQRFGTLGVRGAARPARNSTGRRSSCAAGRPDRPAFVLRCE